MTHSNQNHDFNGKTAPVPGSPGTMASTSKPFNKDMLTEALRRNFQNTVEEGVPDSLMDLINKLK